MQVVTIFGSNSGDKFQLIKQAEIILSQKTGDVIAASSFYETEPWGFECNENFLNRVVVFETRLSPEDFLTACLDTEKILGRIRNYPAKHYASRPIDIDILFYDSLIVQTADLTIPHPRICERNFVLVPLNEILPAFVHPVFHQTIAELLKTCPDHLEVMAIPNPPISG